MSSSTPADHLARQQALDPEQSFAVSAPAGSGKTGLLTQRVLKLLQRCEHPEEVLCITFTRKAAFEMSERILGALEFAAQQPKPDAEHEQLSWQLARDVLARDAENNWQLLSNPSRLRIQTIDGLCRSISKQLPLSSGLGALPDTLELPEQAYAQAVGEFLQVLKTDQPARDHLLILLRHLDNNIDRLESLLTSLLARREQWMPHLLGVRHSNAKQALENTLSQLYREHLDQCIELLAPFASDLALAADFAGSNLAQSNPDNPIAACAGITALPSNSPEEHQQWLSVLELLLTKKHLWRGRLTKNEGFPSDGDKAAKALVKLRKGELLELIGSLGEQPGLLELLEQLRGLPPVHYSDSQWQLLDSLTYLLPQLAAYLRLSFQALGATDFNEVTQAALQALGSSDEPGEALLKLDYSIKHILVDEFQDTASPQMALLQKLTTGWEPGDGRTLFIVGDGMQSCYGFRDANVGLFLEAHAHGIGDIALNSLQLNVNFRSQAGVVNWVNQTFDGAYPKQDDISRGAVKYSSSKAFKPELNIDAVNCYACVADEDDERATLSARHAEADKVVAIIRDAQQTRPDDNIAVLVRSRPHLKFILQKLSEANLSWQATEIDALMSRMAIVDLLSITKALDAPGNRIAWLSFLRSPLIGLSLGDLHALTQFGRSAEHSDWPLIWEQLQHYQANDRISDSGRKILDRCVPILQASWQERRRKSLRTSIQGLWLSLGGPAALTDPSDLENCHSFFELIERHDRGGTIERWPNFEQAVKRLYAMPAANGNDKLQVMTIHKSKGLEFDTVIIPGLDKPPRQDDKELLLWQERIDTSGEAHLLLGPLAPAGEDADPLYRYLRSESQRKDTLESTRLLYVGCTRAIKQLHLLGALKQKDGKLKAPTDKSLLARIWPAFAEQCKNIEATKSTVTQPDNISADTNNTISHSCQAIARLAPEWRMPQLAPNNLLQDYRGNYASDTINSDDLLENPLNHPQGETDEALIARHTGTVIHSTLEQLCIDGIASWTPQRIERQRSFWRVQLLQLGVPGASVADACARIAKHIHSAVCDSASNWIFDASLEQSACELSLLHKGREFIIDRTFVRDGNRWIIDYKSSEPNLGESLEAFLERESNAYRAQLQDYAQAIAATENAIAHTYLYFPVLKCLHKVDFAVPKMQ